MALTIRPPEHRRLAALKRAARIRRWPELDVERLFDLDDLRAGSYLARRMVSDAVLVEGEGDRGRERRCPCRNAVTGVPGSGLAGPRDHRHRHLRDRRCLGQDHLVPELVELCRLSTLRRHRNDAARGKAVVDELVGRRPSRRDTDKQASDHRQHGRKKPTHVAPFAIALAPSGALPLLSQPGPARTAQIVRQITKHCSNPRRGSRPFRQRPVGQSLGRLTHCSGVSSGGVCGSARPATSWPT